MTQDERIAVERAIKILREATGNYLEYQTIVDLAVSAQETIKQLRTDLAAKEEVKQDLARRLLETPGNPTRPSAPATPEEIRAMAERANREGQLPLACILHAVSAAENAGVCVAMAEYVMPFTEHLLHELKQAIAEMKEND